MGALDGTPAMALNGAPDPGPGLTAGSRPGLGVCRPKGLEFVSCEVPSTAGNRQHLARLQVMGAGAVGVLEARHADAAALGDLPQAVAAADAHPLAALLRVLRMMTAAVHRQRRVRAARAPETACRARDECRAGGSSGMSTAATSTAAARPALIERM